MLSCLNKSERNVYEAIIDGLNVKEAADLLFVSPHTIKSHKVEIFKKLEVSSVQQLMSKHIKYLKMRKEESND